MKLLTKTSMLQMIASLLLAVLIVSCQMHPTKVKEKLAPTPDNFRTELITPKTIILDARNMFSYLNGHHPSAMTIRWFDFSRDQTTHRGELKANLKTISDSLARLGIAPNSEILVLGDGAYGDAAEGRVAWMLAYLGVKNVRFAREATMKFKRKTGEQDPVTNVSTWSPNPDNTLIISKADLKKIAKEKNKDPSSPIELIDVRSPREYLKLSPPQDFGAMNIEWKEFIGEDGLPRKEMISKLESVGIKRHHTVVLISEQGVRSALVTMALRELGFSKAVNFAGGYRVLMNKSSLTD